MFLSLFLKDLRISLRTLRHNPGFTAVALLSLALGIGANTAIFSVLDALVFRTLPVAKPEELVMFGDGRGAGLFGGFPDGPARLFSRDFLDHLNASQTVFTGHGAAGISSLIVDAHARLGGQSSTLEPVQIRLVSRAYFDVLGISPAAGRFFDRPAMPELVISHNYWQRRFGGDPAVLGRPVSINGSVYSIAGVAGKGFTGTIVGESPDFWAELALQPKLQSWINNPQEPLAQTLWITARLAPGVTLAVAQSNSEIVYRQWLTRVAGSTAERIAAIPRVRLTLTEASRGTSLLRRQYAEPLQILLGMVGIILLIGSANIANLLLARISSRQREISVRIALGATRTRLVSQLLTESIALAFLGGLLGLLLAWWAAPILVALVTSDPRGVPLDVSPKPVALLFHVALCLITGVLFGIWPALRLTSGRGNTLGEGKGAVVSAGSWPGRLLVIAQVGLAMVLATGAGWFLQTLHKLQNVDPGFDTARTLYVGLDQEAAGLSESAQVLQNQRLEDLLNGTPGIEAASFTMIHFDAGRWVFPVWKEGVDRSSSRGVDRFDGNQVSTRYFDAMGMKVLAGRVFSPFDGPQAERVAVVTESLARKLYPGGGALGRLIYLGRANDAARRIVGIVSDAKIENPREAFGGMVFLHNAQTREGYQDLVVRASGDPQALLPRVREIIRRENPNLAVTEITTMGDLFERSLTQERMLSRLASAFGLLALTLAAVGIYGVLAYNVARRTAEIGVRMALGASPWSVLLMVLRESLFMVGAGVLFGIPAAIAAGKLVASHLYGLTPGDPWTIAGAVGVLLFAAVLASLVPSGRAARMDPLRALRNN